eukprot:8793861-Pyramimonas_sp.AAC.1
MIVIGGAESTRAHAHIHHLRARTSAHTTTDQRGRPARPDQSPRAKSERRCVPFLSSQVSPNGAKHHPKPIVFLFQHARPRGDFWSTSSWIRPRLP